MMKTTSLPRCASKISRRAGSSLLATLIMITTFSIAVAAVLGVANHNTHTTRAQLEYEAAYTAALSGIHTTRALINHPYLAVTMLGNAKLEDDLKLVVGGASGAVKDVLKGNLTGLLTGTGGLVGGLLSRHGLGSLLNVLPDGRIVLLDLPQQNGRIVGFVNDHGNKKFTNSLFNGTAANGYQSFVDRIRITTTPVQDILSLPLDLRNVALIIESRGVVDTGHRRKERVLQERVLILPDLAELPLIGAGAALLTGGDLNVTGNTNFDVLWDPIMAKGDIDIVGLSMNSILPILPGLPLLGANLSASDKYRGPGVKIPGMQDGGQAMKEKWVKYQAGAGSKLDIKNGNLLGSLLGNLLGVTDLFSQINNGGLKLLGIPLTNSNVNLTGKFKDANVTQANGHEYGLYDKNDAGQASNGALVQNSTEVTERVDQFMDAEMDYASLKSIAIARNTYLKPISGQDQYGNQFDQPLYVAEGAVLTTDATEGEPLKKLSQLTMKDKIAAIGGQVHRDDSLRVDDQLLFIDYVGGSKENPGTVYTHELDTGFFWKGLLYICGNVHMQDATGNPGIFVKSPEQFAEDPHGLQRGQTVQNVVMDGILFATGTVSKTGSAALYGTLASKLPLDSLESPQILFNSTNLLGRLRSPVSADLEVRVVLGRVYEVDKWVN